MITTSALHKAKLTLARLSQSESFPDEVSLVIAGKEIPKRSRLYSLTTFMSDENQLLRIRGRLQNSEYSHDKKIPIILSSKHAFTKMLFRHEHERLLHTGPQHLMATVRESYWPIGGRNLAKATLHSCITYFRARPKPAYNLLGNLPKDRVTPNLPFMVVGTDYCGPFQIKKKDGRGAKTIKCYVCIFICMTTKAVHIEPVMDLTTDAFISCFRCFSARRDVPQSIYSDNGSTYRGVKSQLDDPHKFIANNQENLIEAAANQAFSWHFIPPYSPNMGGV